MQQLAEDQLKTVYTIRFPLEYEITKHKLSYLQSLNPQILMAMDSENILTLRENTGFDFKEYENFTLRLPGFEKFMFLELAELNEGILCEFDEKEEIIVKMPTFALISLFTAAVVASLYVWAKSRKSGRVYTEDAGYQLIDPDREGKFFNRMADVSYIDYSKASEAEQDKWNSFIPIPPTLAVEVVSAKKGLKPALKKMEEIWMNTGTDVGVVICPFTKSIYIFDKETTGYKTQSILDLFSHPKLPGYIGDFREYADKF